MYAIATESLLVFPVRFNLSREIKRTSAINTICRKGEADNVLNLTEFADHNASWCYKGQNSDTGCGEECGAF